MTLNDVIWMSVKIVKIIMWKLVCTASVENFGHGKFLMNTFFFYCFWKSCIYLIKNTIYVIKMYLFYT